MKSLLGIGSDTLVDFIRWDLTLQSTNADRKIFTLDINFGEGQPNTSGFKGGGEKRSLHGEYHISAGDKTTINGTIYRLTSDQLPSGISLVRLDDNLLHFLTPQYHLMVGNGGWSYTLSRQEPVNNQPPILPVLTAIPDDTARQVIYDGRTPCLPFAEDYQLTVPSGCFKLKWRLILNRDSVTFAPTDYVIYRTDHRQSEITGTWTSIRKSKDDTLIYQLDPDKAESSISFLVGDENVLFFLDKEQRLYVGDENFSFTLNKRAAPVK